MAINWKRPIEKRYEEPRRRLSGLFWFIFVNLNYSKINFNLGTRRGVKTKKINKEYDVCLLISLSILKLVNNLSDKPKPALWEKSRVCTDEELLFIWYVYFGKDVNDDVEAIRYDMKNAIGEKRREEIKVPDACAGFYNESKEKDVRKNNVGSYFNSISKVKVQECVGYLLTILDNVPKEDEIKAGKMKELFTTFLRNFVTLSEMPHRYFYYFVQCDKKLSNVWDFLCKNYREKVSPQIPGTNKKRFTEYKNEYRTLFPVIRLAGDMLGESPKKQSKNKKV